MKSLLSNAWIVMAASSLLLSCSTADIATQNTIFTFMDTDYAERIMNSFVLTSDVPLGNNEVRSYQSKEYRWKDFVSAYKLAVTEGFGGRTFHVGDSVEEALVNIALFLGQSRHESIRTDSCDENNWTNDAQNGLVYPFSAACGQSDQDYQSYTCSAEKQFMQCPVNPIMVSQARTKARWLGAPPALFCAPRSMTGVVTPRWDPVGQFCGLTREGEVPEFPVPYLEDLLITGLDDKQACNAYVGQTQAFVTFDGCDPVQGCPNTNIGNTYTDVEGCCWWGRGVIQTTGPCNIGELNYYLTGTRYDDGIASQENADAPYPDLNLCEQPSTICDGPPELKWVSGLFFWIFNIQDFSNAVFDFRDFLATQSDTAYNSPDQEVAEELSLRVSGLVNRGCPEAICGSVPTLAIQERFQYYNHTMWYMRHAFDTLGFPLPEDEEPAEIEYDWYDAAVMCRSCEGVIGNCAHTSTSIVPPTCIQVRNLEECIQRGAGISVMCNGVTEFPTLSPIIQPTRRPTISPMPTKKPSDSPSVSPTSSPVNPPPTPTSPNTPSTSAPNSTPNSPNSPSTTASPNSPTSPNSPPGATFPPTDSNGFTPSAPVVFTPSARPTNYPTEEWTDSPTVSRPLDLIYGMCTGCFNNAEGPCIIPSTRECTDYIDEVFNICPTRYFACVVGTASPTMADTDEFTGVRVPTSAPTFTYPEGCFVCRQGTEGPCQREGRRCVGYEDERRRICPDFTKLCLPVTERPTDRPSRYPSHTPTLNPTLNPTEKGSEEPSSVPSVTPTSRPTTARRSAGQQRNNAALYSAIAMMGMIWISIW